MKSDADKIAEAIDRLTKSVGSVPRDSDHMSTAEVDELRLLAEYEGDGLTGFCVSRAYRTDEALSVETDERLVGIWAELSSMGLISTSFSNNQTHVIAVEPRGVWALERYKILRDEKAREEKRRNDHDWRIAIMTGAFGLVGVIAGCLLTWALNSFASPSQVQRDEADYAAAGNAHDEDPYEPHHVERGHPSEKPLV